MSTKPTESGKLGFGQQMYLKRSVYAPIVEAFPPSIHFLPSLQHRSHYSSFLAQPYCTSLTAVFPMAEVSRFLPLPALRLATFSMLLLPQQGSLRSSLPLKLHLPLSNGSVRATWFSLACARSSANQQCFLILRHRLRCIDHSLRESSSIFSIQKLHCSSYRSCRNLLIQIAVRQHFSHSSWDRHLY